MEKSKPRVIKDYEKLKEDIKEQIKLAYPEGFHDHLIDFFDKDGKKISALPFETAEHHLMIRMSIGKAKKIIEDDDDYDNEGILKEDRKEDYEDKFADAFLTDDDE